MEEKLRKSFKYRMYSNKGTARRAFNTMKVFAAIWNCALEERQKSFEQSKKDKTVKPINSYYSQYHLIRKREHQEFKNYNAQSMQDVLVKLDSSYKSFFDLIKKDKTARPPRFKKLHKCITYRQSGWKLEDSKLFLSHIGKFRIKLHRPIEGKIKTVSIIFENGNWYVCFSCEMLVSLPKRKKKVVSIEFPDYLFIQDSDGNVVPHPKFYKEEISELRRLSRNLSRKKRGSNNRKKARHTLKKWHEKIARKRKNYLWQVVKYYTDNFSEIIIEKLPTKKSIQYALTSQQAQKLCDASYGIFVDMLKHKCKEKNVIFTERKSKSWEREIQNLTEAARLEEMEKMLRQAKRMLKYGNLERLLQYKPDPKQVRI